MELASPVLPAFAYVRAETADEVSNLLLEHSSEARLFMGGTDILVRMRDGVYAPKMLIDVKHLPGMNEIGFNRQTGLRLGAAVNMNAMAAHPDVIENYPLLVEAADSVSSYQLRTRATIGGNLCNASPAADTAPAALVLEAALVVWGPDGEREVPATEFFLGPGKSALQPGEFLTSIRIPILPAGSVGRYVKLGRNAGGDLAIVGVAVMAYPDEIAASGYRFRIALASVAPTPIRVPDAEAILAQQPLTDETLDQAAKAAQDSARPIGDVRSSAQYRKAMVKNLTRRVLTDVRATSQKEA